MNIQTHHSGQISGQLPNQAGSALPGQPQQNINSVHGQMQNPNIQHNVPNMDPDTLRVRKYMLQKIWEFLMQRRQQSPDVSTRKLMDLVRRLEEGLFKTAITKEEYLNLDTLESRLHILIKRLPMPNHNQQLSNQNQQLGNHTHQLSNHSQPFSHANSSPSIGAMIPTPGFQQSGNSSGESSLVANNSSSTNTTPIVNSENFVTTGYQQSTSSFPVNPGGNKTTTSMGAHRMTTQMIPVPGINNSNNNDINRSANNRVLMNMESSSETAIASQPMPQKPHVGGQNSRMLRNIGGGMRTSLQQKSYGSSSGGLGLMRNNGTPGTSEGNLIGTVHGNQPFDQHQQLGMHGDGYGNGTADASGSGNLYIPVTSVGLAANNQSLNAVSMQSTPKTNSPSTTVNQLNVHSTQPVTSMKPHSIDQPENMNFQSQYATRENLVQPHQRQQFQQPSHQFQRQQLAQHQVQQNKQMENQHLFKSDPFSPSQPSYNTVSEVKSEVKTEHHREALQSSDRFQFSDMQRQFQQNTMEDQTGASRNSEQMHSHDFTANLQSDFGGLSGGVQPEYSNSQDFSHLSGRNPLDHNVQDEFHHRLTGQDVAQLNNLSSEEPMIGQPDNYRLAEPLNTSDTVRQSNDINRERQFKNQQKWLLFLRHARRCPAPEGKCQDPNCLTVQKLLKHMQHCDICQCSYPRCRATRLLVNHHRRCRDTNCPVCIPVKNFVQAQLKGLVNPGLSITTASSVNGACKSRDIAETVGNATKNMGPLIMRTPEELQASTKRIKIEHGSQSLVSESERSVALASTVNERHIQDAQHTEQHHTCNIPVKSESTEVKKEVSEHVGQSSPKIMEIKKDKTDDVYIQSPETHPVAPKNPAGFGVEEVVKTDKEMVEADLEKTSQPPENASKSGKPKIKGVSMIELFTPEEVRQHIMGLRRWVGQSRAKAERNQAMEHLMTENSCQLCAVEKLTFEPPPIYCTPCGARIKRNAMYYTIGAGDARHCFCIPCYNEARGETITVDGTAISKSRVEKKKNDDEVEEWWVQCDKCEAWQHQICALFNGRRNDGGQAEYTCPNCYVEEVERGERVPLPQSAVLGAQDLPRTNLSDHLEQRLFSKLKQERQDRARAQGKSYDQVLGAEALVVRVVSSVDKKLDVKPRFLEIFQEENYPIEFPYKSKVVLLFQNIEGVEVCLFGMYVQEFGAECEQPNHRRVYLSYLDSVKYFRPEVRTVTGEALRTFVYHEILIGYLEYCKNRGFTSCYIWACPPLKGEDYILYCHPEIQKTPKSDKLREWYLSMLRKATKENIVVELTNLYEHFFVTTGECKAKVTAARLPYFDGDYWPGAAEDIISQLQQEEDGRKHSKKGIMKKSITKRALKASGQTDLSSNASKDLMLMHKLGETISPMKEDFIMVHLQHACTHCCILMVSGTRWVCRQCKNFNLCDKCYDSERMRDDRERHPINQKDKHTLYSVEITGIPDDTKDKDEILESEFFDTRQAFLSLCQGNHYQYDTLRRAKHSSMMALYHLHNPTAPAFVTQCLKCHQDIETGQGWRCETCPEYDICNACYQDGGGKDHPHKLTNNPSNDNAQNKEARQSRVTQLKKMLELLVHASQCRSPLCPYPNCRKVKGLFRHGMACKTRVSGGCVLCKKMWYLLQLHARACKVSQCHVPRCRDLKEHMRRLQQQSDSRRRAAVMEMMRQRAAEVAGSS